MSLDANAFFPAVFKPGAFHRARSPVQTPRGTIGVFALGAFNGAAFRPRSLDYTYAGSPGQPTDPTPSGIWSRRPRSGSTWARIGRDNSIWTRTPRD